MSAHRAEFAVTRMCEVLGLSTSGFYAWLKRGPSKRAREDAELLRKIRQYHEASRGTYGAPRIRADLADEGIYVSEKRVARLMKADGLSGVTRRRKYVPTTIRDESRRPAPDLVERDFTADGPDELWVADITYVPTDEGFLYLSVVLDVWSRRIVGWGMGSSLESELIVRALEMAVERRRPDSVIHHSDQGCQYTSFAFGRRCKVHGVRPSMGSVGDCYDNAMCESFFASLECELLDRMVFESHWVARQEVFSYIEGFYNRRRRHSALGQMSPCDFEAEHDPSSRELAEAA